jgi:hypothetical protein
VALADNVWLAKVTIDRDTANQKNFFAAFLILLNFNFWESNRNAFNIYATRSVQQASEIESLDGEVQSTIENPLRQRTLNML